MRLLLQLATRNLFRHPRRSALTGIVLVFGLAALMFTDGWLLGIQETMVKSATETFLGHAQIHAPGFRKTRDSDLLIKQPDEVLSILTHHPEVSAFSPRIILRGMISSPTDAIPIELIGIDPDKEVFVSRLAKTVKKGGLPRPTPDKGIMIGQRLANRLDVELGSRVVATVTQVESGQLIQELFRVEGIFSFGSRQMDEGVAFIHLDHARSIANIPNSFHEIALRFHNRRLADQPELPLFVAIRHLGNQARGWPALLPSVKAQLDMSYLSLAIVVFILFSLIALVIVNTMFMSIYERLFELSVMSAIGTRPWQIFRLILFEVAALAVLSCVAGLLFGGLLILYFSHFGLDYGGIEINQVAFYEPIRVIPHVRQFTSLPLLIIALAILGGLYPASFAARIRPAEGLRKAN